MIGGSRRWTATRQLSVAQGGHASCTAGNDEGEGEGRAGSLPGCGANQDIDSGADCGPDTWQPEGERQGRWVGEGEEGVNFVL